jgi:amidophosphoribosyltransferase
VKPESFPISAEFDKPREKCGVFGVTSREGLAAIDVSIGLNQLQHRGQDAAGIAVWNGQSLKIEGGPGKVRQIFGQEKLSKLEDGIIGIGHTRYPTAGGENLSGEYQPIMRHIEDRDYGFGFGHNGNLTVIDGQRVSYDSSDSDSETMADMLQQDIEQSGETVYEALKRVLPRVEGAYTLVVMDKDQLIGVRDPNGFRPLLVGTTQEGGWCFSSETGAMRKIGVKNIREVEPGQILRVKDNELRFDYIEVPAREESFCINEFVYFSREDQMWRGESVQTRRMRIGYELAEEYPIDADVVMGVPGTAIPIGMGYSTKTGIPYEQGIIKHGDRSFMQPNQQARQAEAETKISIIPDLIYGRRLIIVDDSIVRGVMTKTIIEMLFEAGAEEVHVLVGSPPHVSGCHYGMDTGRENNLIASGKSVEEVRDYIGSTSLNYLSQHRLVRAASPELNYFCTACFDGNYPTPIPVQIGRVASQIAE